MLTAIVQLMLIRFWTLQQLHCLIEQPMHPCLWLSHHTLFGVGLHVSGAFSWVTPRSLNIDHSIYLTPLFFPVTGLHAQYNTIQYHTIQHNTNVIGTPQVGFSVLILLPPRTRWWTQTKIFRRRFVTKTWANISRKHLPSFRTVLLKGTQ